MSSGKIIGIDLGTTNSCVAVLKSGSAEPEVIINAEGEKIEEGLFMCGDIGMKKNDVEDLEVRMNDAAAEWNGTAKCELNIEAK